jgi:predicted nucleic acid-binding protein
VLETVHHDDEVTPMSKYVIGPQVALCLAHEDATIGNEQQLLAPTLFRSQVLSLLYQSVRAGKMSKQEADRQLKYVRGLRIRLLGDRVLQDRAWKIADQLGWPDALNAEYIALTQLQADAFITLNKEFAATVESLVTVAPFDALA